MLRRAPQLQRKGQRTFPLHLWKQLYLAAITEGPDPPQATDPEHQTSPDMTKCSLPHLSSYVTKTLLVKAFFMQPRLLPV